MKKGLLVLSLLLLSLVGQAQHLTLARLVKLQQDDLQQTNLFFITYTWQAVQTQGSSRGGAYRIAWEKQTATDQGRCEVAYPALGPDGSTADSTGATVTYYFTSRTDYIRLKRDVELAAAQPLDSVRLEGQVVLAAYQVGPRVLLLGPLPLAPQEPHYMAQLLPLADLARARKSYAPTSK